MLQTTFSHTFLKIFAVMSCFPCFTTIGDTGKLTENFRITKVTFLYTMSAAERRFVPIHQHYLIYLRNLRWQRNGAEVYCRYCFPIVIIVHVMRSGVHAATSKDAPRHQLIAKTATRNKSWYVPRRNRGLHKPLGYEWPTQSRSHDMVQAFRFER